VPYSFGLVGLKGMLAATVSVPAIFTSSTSASASAPPRAGPPAVAFAFAGEVLPDAFFLLISLSWWM